jgi:hypothetical protein
LIHIKRYRRVRSVTTPPELYPAIVRTVPSHATRCLDVRSPTALQQRHAGRAFDTGRGAAPVLLSRVWRYSEMRLDLLGWIIRHAQHHYAHGGPHRSLGQQTPDHAEHAPSAPINLAEHCVHRRAILGGITHEYWTAAAA